MIQFTYPLVLYNSKSLCLLDGLSKFVLHLFLEININQIQENNWNIHTKFYVILVIDNLIHILINQSFNQYQLRKKRTYEKNKDENAHRFALSAIRGKLLESDIVLDIIDTRVTYYR